MIPELSEAISCTRQSTELVKHVVYHFGTFHFTAVFIDYIIIHNFTTTIMTMQYTKTSTPNQICLD